MKRKIDFETRSLAPLNFDNTKGHAMAFYRSQLANVYEYDPTEDGPEVPIIKGILISLDYRYAPGFEAWSLAIEAVANRISQFLYSKQYRELGRGKRAEKVRSLIQLEFTVLD